MPLSPITVTRGVVIVPKRLFATSVFTDSGARGYRRLFPLWCGNEIVGIPLHEGRGGWTQRSPWRLFVTSNAGGGGLGAMPPP